MTAPEDQHPSGAELPSGSVVPGADIWDDNDEDDVAWMTEAQVVVHESQSTSDALSDIAEPDGPDEPDGVRLAPEAIEDDPVFDGREDEALTGRIAKWGRTSMVGASISAIGIGLEKILYPDQSVEIEIQKDTDEDDPLNPLTVQLDDEHPELSVATYRPWITRRSIHDP